MLIYFKAGTVTSGNRGHAGRKGKKGGSAPQAKPITASKLTFKANSKLASQSDSSLRATPLPANGYDFRARNTLSKMSIPVDGYPDERDVIDFCKKQQGFDKPSPNTDNVPFNTMLDQWDKPVNIAKDIKLIDSRVLEDEYASHTQSLYNSIIAIEQAHLKDNPDLSNLSSKEWKEKKLELALVYAGGEQAYAIMQGYDGVAGSKSGKLLVLYNDTKKIVDPPAKPLDTVDQSTLLSRNSITPDGVAFYADSPYVTDKVRSMLTRPVRNLDYADHQLLQDEIDRVHRETYPNQQHYDHVLAALEKAKGFDGMPTIISDDEAMAIYKAATKRGQMGTLDPDNVIMFRGVGDPTNIGICKDMREGNHYAGRGIYGNGMYMADVGTAIAYSDGKNVQPMFLGKDTKFANYKTFNNNKRNIVERLKSEVEAIETAHLSKNSSLSNLNDPVWVEKKVSLMLTNTDNARWAVINGYDGFYIPNAGTNSGAGGGGKPYFNMFNRSKMRMTSSTFQTFPQTIIKSLSSNKFTNYYNSLMPYDVYK